MKLFKTKQSSFIAIVTVWMLASLSLVAAQDQTTNAPQNKPDKPVNSLPTVYLVGDSTVNNSSGEFVGWGNVIGEYFDAAKINVVNRARGGRSSRTFFNEGLWQKVSDELKPGDFVLIQFGHNDGGAIDKEKMRGSIPGIGEETQEVTNEATGAKETVHSYGWYLRRYIADARSKGTTPIILSPVPRNIWHDGTLERKDKYRGWANEIASAAHIPFIDLNEIVAREYASIGAGKVGAEYFTTKDHTHTSAAGARANAAAVVKGIRELPHSSLKKYLK